MPATFARDRAEIYLMSRWALGESQRQAAFLHATIMETVSRINSETGAQDYWDDVVSNYSETFGLHLQPVTSATSSSSNITTGDGAISTMPSPGTVSKAFHNQEQMLQKQYEAIGECLQINQGIAAPNFLHQERKVAELLDKIHAWEAELSTDFYQGIKSQFATEKPRRYNSWWNDARVTLIRLCFNFGRDTIISTDDTTRNEYIHRKISNRADLQLVAMGNAMAVYSRHLSGSLSTGWFNVVSSISANVSQPPTARLLLQATRPSTFVTDAGETSYQEVPRYLKGCSKSLPYPKFLAESILRTPTTQLITRLESKDTPEADYTHLMIRTMAEACGPGVTFENQLILVTGAGRNSIGAELVKILLEGGARVIATTHRDMPTVAEYYQALYEDNGAKGSEMHLVPFNQGSVRDCEALINYIYETFCTGTTARDLHAIIPLAAGSEAGAEIDQIGASNELTHRIMLTNTIRILGRVIEQKRRRNIYCHPTQVLLPLSPNHGTFGGDGLYSESKLGLESLLQRAQSESWSDMLSVCGVKIGWTRSTGLMAANDVLAEALETSHDVLTFSPREMAWNMATLLAPALNKLNEDGPLLADFSGGLGSVTGLHGFLATERERLSMESRIKKAIKYEDDREMKAAAPVSAQSPSAGTKPPRKSTLRVGFPRLRAHIPDPILQQLDLAKTVVVVGFSELGPWGSSRLRWEMESQGKLSVDGFVEMAWLMGLIQHSSSRTHLTNTLKDRKPYVGWVDAETGDPVKDSDVASRYGSIIAANTGIRFVYDKQRDLDPGTKAVELLHETILQADLPSFPTTLSNAEALKRKHGDEFVSVSRLPSDPPDSCHVRIRRGATILLPKSELSSWATVAGHLPHGWKAAHYGIPDEIIKSVDPVTLYAVCCASEAFHSAGITDPLEIFRHIHLSEFGNFVGSSMGGALKTRHLYRSAYYDHEEIQADTLQDTYANTTAAWINMLMLGATGPIKTPVGACATGVESIDTAMESIQAGKVKMCLVGGCDDLLEEEAHGFARMKATVDVEAELRRGRAPAEMSRPTAESRAGFVESQGCGLQLLCRGDVALDMGLPIYAVLAGSAMAADKIGRSVPAPGQGILSFAKESTSAGSLPPTFAAPLRQALSTWGLGIDDLDVASLHGTSTKAGDLNEADVICKQMAHLGRTEAKPLLAVCQKSITGHPKAPAAAWMLNGCLQMLDSGVIPGNRNADNVDPALQRFRHLCYPTRAIHLPPQSDVKAFILTSFGFGQKSGQVVGVAPRYFFSSLYPEQFSDYEQRTRKRQMRADSAYAKSLMSNQIVALQDTPPYATQDADAIFMNPEARIAFDEESHTHVFPAR